MHFFARLQPYVRERKHHNKVFSPASAKSQLPPFITLSTARNNTLLSSSSNSILWTMFPSTNPSDDNRMWSHGHYDNQGPPPGMASSSATHTPHDRARTDWADATGQLDYFASAGFNNNDSMSFAAVPFVSISPMTRSGVYDDASYAAAATLATVRYPSQELRNDDMMKLSPPKSDINAKQQRPSSPSPLPPLPAPEEVTSMAGTTAGATARLNKGLSQMDIDEPLPNGSSNANVLDSFELGVGMDSVPTGQPKSEGLDDYTKNDNKPATKVSLSPPPKAENQESRAASKSSRKKAKGKSKKATTGIIEPAEVDILRGRGGLTNRHPGNMKFRDEARKLKGTYKNADTSRHEKFLLSQVSTSNACISYMLIFVAPL